MNASRALLVVAAALVWASPLRAQLPVWGLEVAPAAAGSGAAVVALVSASPADAAGIRVGDVVKRAAGRDVAGPEDFRAAALAAASTGELALVVSRDGWEREIRLRARPSHAAFGFTLRARPTGAPEIGAIVPNGPAASAGLIPGDGVQGADGREMSDPAALAALLDDFATRGQPVALVVERANWTRQVTLAPRAPVASPGAAAGAAAAAAPRPPPPGPAPVVAPAPSSSAPVVAPVPAPQPPATPPAPLPTAPAPAAVAPARLPPIPVPANVVTPDTPRTVRPVQSPAAAAGQRVDPVSELNQANRAYEAADWTAAAAHYQNVLAVLPEEARSWGRLCHALVMQQRYAEAAETCQDAAQFAKREASVHQNTGYSLFRLGRAPESIPWYERAIILAPESPLAYSGIGSAWFAMRDWARAEDAYRRVVALDPSNQSGWQALADAMGENGKSTEAIAAYRKALSLGPGSPELLRGLGWQLYREGRYTDADAALREANRLNPKDANTLVTLGAVLDKMGRMAEAREAWQRASELDPGGPLGALARQGLASLASRQASATAADTPRTFEVPRPPPVTPADEPRTIREPETDTGL